jgi:tetratricopeptide (TPR) repeat protein
MKSVLAHALSILLATAVLSPVVVAQDPIVPPEGIPVESDWLYRQHYAQIQEILALPDIAEREKRLLAYNSKVSSKAKISQHMPAFLSQVVEAYQKAGQAQQASALQQKLAEMYPEAAKAAKGANFLQAYQSKNYAKAIELGEPLYAETKDTQVLSMLADSYIGSKNEAKSVEYCNKAVAALGDKKGVNYLYWLAENYQRKQDLNQAGTYYSRLLRAYPKTTPEGWDAKAWGHVLATGNGVLATNAYVKEDFENAIKYFNESLSYSPHNDHAYLFMGLSYWKIQELDLAMDAFAKATAIGKGNSAKAREYLEQLYKPRNGGSLDGLEDFLVAAKQALNL